MPRQAYDGCGCGPLDLEAGLIERARPRPSARRREQRQLEEARRFETAPPAERGLVGPVGTRQEDFAAAPGEERDDLGGLDAVGQEEVPHREAAAARQGGIAACRGQLVGPERARDVGEHSRAVALAVDHAGAVREAGHTVEDELEYAARRHRILAGDGDQRTRVVLDCHSASINKEASRCSGGFRRLRGPSGRD